MKCPCCDTELTRAGYLPEIRGWMRYGDTYCADCSWVFPRELLDEDSVLGDICPCHGPIQTVKPKPS
jgi:hypothetical protein